MRSRKRNSFVSRALLTLTALVISGVILFIAGCSQGKWKDGTYTGEAAGNNGPVKVSVTVKAGKISSVEVVEHKETPVLSDPAISQIPKSVVKKQTWEVDSVSGATRTSDAIKNAVKNALENAAK